MRTEQEYRNLERRLEKIRNTWRDGLGSWMSAALEDPKVSIEMKQDIQLFFDAVEQDP